jgi:hypothetical protein
MRKAVFWLLFAAAGAFAQGPIQIPATPEVNAERAKGIVDALRQQLDHLNPANSGRRTPVRLQGSPALKPGVCAAPLLHAVPPGTADGMTVFPPSGSGRESGDTMKVPAPACDEHLFTNGRAVTPLPALRSEPRTAVPIPRPGTE